MGPRHSQFLISVGDLCVAAALAQLEVDVLTDAGDTVRGIPGSIHQTTGEREVDHSGYDPAFRVAAHVVNLPDIVACTVHAPDDAES